MAVRDQNINKARWRAGREACLVWKPTELIEECGIIKMAYLISEVCFFFISHLWPAPLFYCVGLVCQWVWGLWTWMGILAPQLLVGSATPHLWREGAACEYHARTVSVTATHTFFGLLIPQLTLFLFVYVLHFMTHTVLRGITKLYHYIYSTSICSSLKLNISFHWSFKLKTSIILIQLWFAYWNIPLCVFVAAWHYETPQRVQFVEKLSDVVIGQLPNFWKLWISYVNGSLFSEVNT